MRCIQNLVSIGEKTVSQELAMMAVLAAMKSWRNFLKSRRVVLFTDGESVRGSFLKTWSANKDNNDMINVIFKVEGVCRSFMDRESSKSK